MKKQDVLKMLAGLFLIGILFTPQGSDTWLYFLVPGLVFGVLWFMKL